MFQFEVAIMTSFVSSLYMNKYEVIVLQCFNSRLRLTFVVGISQTCGSLHADDFQSGIMSYASDQVNGRNHGTALDLRVELREWLHGRAVSASPWPNTIGLSFTFCRSISIERMCGENSLGFDNESVDEFCRFLCGHSSWFNRCVVFCLHQ